MAGPFAHMQLCQTLSISEPTVRTMFFETVAGHWLTIQGLIATAGLFIYLTTSHTLHLRRHPSAALVWVAALALLPYIALPLYLIFGIRKVGSFRPAAIARYELATPEPVAETLPAQTQRLATVMALPAASSYTQLNIHADGRTRCKRCAA